MRAVQVQKIKTNVHKQVLQTNVHECQFVFRERGRGEQAFVFEGGVPLRGHPQRKRTVPCSDGVLSLCSYLDV